MRSRTPAIALALVLAATLAGLVRSAEDDRTGTLNGEVVGIDASGSMVTVRCNSDEREDAGKTVSFAVNEKTTILKDGKPIPLSELDAGDHVTVNYTSQEGSNVALAIGVHEERA
jgi:hypothetical protein